MCRIPTVDDINPKIPFKGSMGVPLLASFKGSKGFRV